MNRFDAAGAFLVAAALAGCSGALPPEDYAGTPRFGVRGEITSTNPFLPTEAVVAWQLDPAPAISSMMLGPRSEPPASSSAFPVFFILLFDPPPAQALHRLREGEAAFARGVVLGVPDNYSDVDIGEAFATRAAGFGADVDHWLVYVEEDALPGTLTAWWLGGPLARGYHLLRVEPLDLSCTTQEALDACAAELVAAGVADDRTENPGTARGYCLAPYRLVPDDSASLSVHLGTYVLPPPPVACAQP